MSSTTWMVKRNGSVVGPVTWDELQRAAEAGTVRAGDMVWRNDQTHWRPAAEARNDDSPVEFSPPPIETAQKAVPAIAVNGRPSPSLQLATISVGDANAPSDSQENEAESTALATSTPARSSTGSALLALLIAIIGLFSFGMLCGGLSIAIAGSSIQKGNELARFLGAVALLLGLAELGVMVAAQFR